MLGNTNNKCYSTINYLKDSIQYNDDFYNIKVVDYDGTIIDERNIQEGQEYTLPTPPIHDKLIFNSWVCSNASIANNKITMGKVDLLIGATYTIEQNKSIFEIELNKITGKTVTLKIDGSKDWGDGTSDTSTTHTYSNYGEYTILCSGTTITSSSSSGIFGQSSSSINYYVKSAKVSCAIPSCTFMYCRSLTSVVISANPAVQLNASTFNRCYSLKCLIIAENAKYISNDFFSYNYSLSYFIAPTVSTYNTVGATSFSNCCSLSNLALSNGITTINDGAFSNCYSLEKLIMPSKIQKIGWGTSSVFGQCYRLKLFDFSLAESIPTLGNANILFTQTPNWPRIKVPFNLYYDWINSEQWSSYYDYIISAEYLTINFTGDIIDIYVNNRLITNRTIQWGGSSIEYYCKDSSSNTVLPPQIITGLLPNTTQNINIDLSIKTKITLNTGISGLYTLFIINNEAFEAIDNNGSYEITVIGNGVTVNYIINGGDSYLDKTGSFITSGTNITEAITMTPCSIQTFTRPNLTADGTMGGNDFAVSDPDPDHIYSYPWKAVDSNSSTYWGVTSNITYEYADFIFYNPNALKVTELIISHPSTGYMESSIIISGSNDNSSWCQLESTYSKSSSTSTVNITNNIYYKYYFLRFKPGRLRVSDIAITAVYKT